MIVLPKEKIVLLKRIFMFVLIKLFWTSETKKCKSAIQTETNDVLFMIMAKKIVYSCFIENNFCVS